MTSRPVAIVGAGVSGLAAAYYLARQGIESVLIEKELRTGGLIRSERIENCLLEAGPDSFLSAKPAVNEVAAEIEGLTEQLISSNDAARRVFIVRKGRLTPFPQGMSMMVPGELKPALRSPLFGIRTKLRLVTEIYRKPRERSDDVSVGELVGSHFGHELLEYVADPLLAGVYGGDAANLSARSVLPRFVDYERRFGSLVKGVQHERKTGSNTALFQSFRDGMEALTTGLRTAVGRWSPVLQGEALSVERQTDGWRVRLKDNSVRTDHLIVACPAGRAGRLFETSAPAFANQLLAIPYTSAILINLVYDAAEIDHPLDGFGFLVPQRERRTIAAATFINRKFPIRVAPGMVAIRVFVVGREAVRLQSASDQDLVVLVQEDVKRLTDIGATPRAIRVDRWPNAMPQYVVGHEQRVRDIRQSTAQLPSLHVIGNAYDGVGIPDCVRLAKAAAEQIAADIIKSS